MAFLKKWFLRPIKLDPLTRKMTSISLFEAPEPSKHALEVSVSDIPPPGQIQKFREVRQASAGQASAG